MLPYSIERQSYFWEDISIIEDWYKKCSITFLFSCFQTTLLPDFSATWDSTSICPHCLQFSRPKTGKRLDWKKGIYRVAAMLYRSWHTWLLYVELTKFRVFTAFPTLIVELKMKIPKAFSCITKCTLVHWCKSIFFKVCFNVKTRIIMIKLKAEKSRIELWYYL